MFLCLVQRCLETGRQVGGIYSIYGFSAKAGIMGWEFAPENLEKMISNSRFSFLNKKFNLLGQLFGWIWRPLALGAGVVVTSIFPPKEAQKSK